MALFTGMQVDKDDTFEDTCTLYLGSTGMSLMQLTESSALVWALIWFDLFTFTI